MRLTVEESVNYFAAMSLILHSAGSRLLFVLLTGLLLSSSRPASFVLTLVEIEQLSNEYVGDDWSHTVQVDGWELQENDQIDLASAEAYTITCTSREDDPYYPDSGSRTLEMSEAEMVTASGEGGFSVDVTVREGHGEYAGNQAVWRFHFALR